MFEEIFIQMKMENDSCWLNLMKIMKTFLYNLMKLKHSKISLENHYFEQIFFDTFSFNNKIRKEIT